MVKFSSLLKVQKSVPQVQAVTFMKATNQQPGTVERCLMLSIYCSFEIIILALTNLLTSRFLMIMTF